MRSWMVPSLLLVPGLAVAGPQKVTFPSQDGLQITADLYQEVKNPRAPFIVLFHQAGWSRGEYREIAPKLNARGYNCLAVDQRSGGAVNGVDNETHQRAQKAGKKTRYVDAYVDMVAALKYARDKHARGRVLAWGSSYSSALALKLAGDKPELVDGVLAFAPGEYFHKQGKSRNWIQKSAARIERPVFITSAKREHAAWKAIFEAVPSTAKTSYLPATRGQHGSRALWSKFGDSDGYWAAVDAFLRANFARKKGR